MLEPMPEFTGCKIALLLEDKLVMYLRDDKPGLQFANTWDFPGGGREGEEAPFECVSREVTEEFSIRLDPSQVIWKKEHPSMRDPNARAYFFVARITLEQVTAIKFGNEGQRWELVNVDDFIFRDDIVPHLKSRFQDYLDGKV